MCDIMKNKYILQKKLRKISIVLVIYVLTMSVGYAFFQKSLQINGVASTVDYYEGEKLPTNAIIRNTKNNYFFTSNFDSSYLLSYESETWQDDTYTLILDKALLKSMQNKTITYTITFRNPTTLNYTNGVISTSTDGSISDITSTSGSLSAIEIAPNGKTDVSLSITTGNFNSYDSVAKATITYTYQNKPRYFNIVIKYAANLGYENLFTDELLLNDYGKVVSKNGTDLNVNGYPATYYKIHQPLFKQLLEKLEAGATYQCIRDYQGTANASNGTISFRNSSSEVIKLSIYGKGLKSNTFKLTQEQIDSIDRMYLYGHKTDGVFKFIILRKIK